MNLEREGPALEVLLRRVAETPAEFLLAPRIGESGEVHVPAVVYEVLRAHGLDIPLPELAVFAGRDERTDRARLSMTLLLAWMLAEESLRPAMTNLEGVLALLRDDAAELAAHANAARVMRDADRREEISRLVLARLHLRPAGESAAQAMDRLTALSSTERARMLKASRAAEERARAIRAALARKAAEESADKWTRE